MPSNDAQCFFGALSGVLHGEGVPVHEAVLETELKTTGSKFAYVQNKLKSERPMMEQIQLNIKERGALDALKVTDFVEKTLDLDLPSFRGLILKPFDLFEGIDNPSHPLHEMITLQEEHVKAHPNLDAYEVYQKEVSERVAELANRVEFEYADPVIQKYWNEYVDYTINGGDLYRGIANQRLGRSGLVRNPIMKKLGDFLGNFVTQNPMIALYNVFEFMPKAMVFALDKSNGDLVKAWGSIFKAMAQTMDATGGKFWTKVPELEAQGIYHKGLSTGEGKIAKFFQDRIGISNVVDGTENPLRTTAHYLGEALGPGLGAEAVEKIAFQYRIGNTPMALRSVEGAATLHLMRYGLEAMRLYGGMWNTAIPGLKPGVTPQQRMNAIGGLVLFHMMTAAQTGVSSTIPQPLWLAMPEDMKEEIQAFDTKYSALGGGGLLSPSLEISKMQRPFSGLAFGAGLQFMNDTIQRSATKLASVPATAADKGLDQATWDAFEGLFGIMMLGRTPGINWTSFKTFKTMRKAAEGQDFGEAMGEQFRLGPESHLPLVEAEE